MDERLPLPPPSVEEQLDGLGLFDKGDDLEARFQAFHIKHPEVYRLLVALARQWLARTKGRRLGIGMLWERLRWDAAIGGLPDVGEDFKLNNSYRSRYARLIMAREPDLADIFETRTLTS